MTTEGTPRTVVSALVTAGLVGAERSADAERVVTAALAPAAAPRPPLRRRVSEIAGYVGGAFVVGAAVLFLGNEWETLGRAGQVGVLAVIAALLAAATVLLVAAAGGRSAVREPAQQVRRRLASVLCTGAAVAAGLAAGVLAEEPGTFDDGSRRVLVGAAVALVVALAGYRTAPSVVGQLGVAAAAFLMIPSGLDTAGEVTVLGMGGLVLLLGLLWLVLAERGVWREDESARVIGTALAVVGAQIPVFDHPAWVGYLATAVVAAAAFAGYVVRPAWPYLAGGVAAATLAVPEALSDWTGGSLGSAGVLLATGVTLLVAALLGLRLRHEVSDGGHA